MNYEAEVVNECHPLQNPLILQKVLSNLRVAELKRFRYVSSLWNQKAKYILEKSAITLFRYILGKSTSDLAGFSRHFEHGHEGWSDKLFEFSFDMKHSHFENYKLKMENVPRHLHGKLSNFSTFDTIFELIGHKIRHLEYHIKCLANENLHTFTSTWNARLLLLRHLVIKFDALECDFFMPSDLIKNSNSLETLELRIDNSNNGPNFPHAYIQIVQNLVQCSPNIKSFILTSDKPMDDTVDSEFIDAVYYLLESLTKLERVKIAWKCPPSNCDVLFNLPPNLKHLHIILPKVISTSAIELFLSRHAATLEILHLVIPTTNVNVLFSLPIFLCLRVFAIERCQLASNPELVEEQLKFAFVDKKLNYKNQFPILTNLSFTTAGNEDVFQKVIEQFVDIQEKPVTTLSSIKVTPSTLLNLDLKRKLFNNFPNASIES